MKASRQSESRLAQRREDAWFLRVRYTQRTDALANVDAPAFLFADLAQILEQLIIAAASRLVREVALC